MDFRLQSLQGFNYEKLDDLNNIFIPNSEGNMIPLRSVDSLKTNNVANIALKERFRAVLMTAFNCVLGVLPMIIATGAGANSQKTIGVPLFFGMFLSTFVGLFFVPLLYTLVLSFLEKYKKNK